MQNALLNRTTRIDPIPGTVGLLKARWSARGKGKRGGLRTIYFHMLDADTYLMLLIFSKSETGDLTEDQKKMLRHLVERELLEGAES